MSVLLVAQHEGVARKRSLPDAIRVDNGSEFYSRVMDAWAYRRGVRLDFIRPGKPTENGHIESFNGRPSPLLGVLLRDGQRFPNSGLLPRSHITETWPLLAASYDENLPPETVKARRVSGALPRPT